MALRNQKWLTALILVLLGGILLLVVFDKPPALPALMILPTTPLAVTSNRLPDRWIPAKWIWLQRVWLFVFGPPRQVQFNLQCISSSETVASIVSQNSLGLPQAESKGLAVWMIPDGTLRQRKGASTIMARPRVSTSDQGEARVIFGDYSADLFARLEKETVDLSTRLIVYSSGQTNFVAAMRAQLPYGQTLFVLDVRQPEVATNRFEFLITADEYDAKGNKISPRPPSGK
jgi:hypothetical protein